MPATLLKSVTSDSVFKRHFIINNSRKLLAITTSESSFAREFTIDKFTFIFIAICIGIDSFAVELTIKKFTYVFIAISIVSSCLVYNGRTSRCRNAFLCIGRRSTGNRSASCSDLQLVACAIIVCTVSEAGWVDTSTVSGFHVHRDADDSSFVSTQNALPGYSVDSRGCGD